MFIENAFNLALNTKKMTCYILFEPEGLFVLRAILGLRRCTKTLSSAPEDDYYYNQNMFPNLSNRA